MPPSGRRTITICAIIRTEYGPRRRVQMTSSLRKGDACSWSQRATLLGGEPLPRSCTRQHTTVQPRAVVMHGSSPTVGEVRYDPIMARLDQPPLMRTADGHDEDEVVRVEFCLQSSVQLLRALVRQQQEAQLKGLVPRASWPGRNFLNQLVVALTRSSEIIAHPVSRHSDTSRRTRSGVGSAVVGDSTCCVAFDNGA